MKPIYIYDNNKNDDMVTLKKEDFEKYINDAYDQGKKDGMLINYNQPLISQT